MRQTWLCRARRVSKNERYGTHPDARVALTRAITEASQTRAVNIQGARDDLKNTIQGETQNGKKKWLLTQVFIKQRHMDKVKCVTEFADKTIGQWAAQWWNWYLSEDPDDKPIVDNMLFLRGGFSHNNRFKDNHQAATITPQTAIFINVIDSVFPISHKDHKDDAGKEFKIKGLDDKELQTEDDIRRAILRERTSCKIASISKTADGDRDDIIPDGHSWQRAESSKFTLKVSKKSKFKNDFKPPFPSSSGIKSDHDYDYFDAVCGGYYIIIDPLPPSDESYHIHFEARGESGYTNSGTSDIKVQ